MNGWVLVWNPLLVTNQYKTLDVLLNLPELLFSHL